MTPQVHEIAKGVAQNGFSWQEDGSAVLQIMALLVSELPVKPAGRDIIAVSREWLLSSIKLLDRLHGWTMRGKTQIQEDQLYGMFVDLYLQEFNK